MGSLNQWRQVRGKKLEWTFECNTVTTSSPYYEISIRRTDNGLAQYRFTEAKAEFGSVATPFVADSPEDNLAKCQRYTYKLEQATGSSVTIYGFHVSQTATARHIQVTFPVTMRGVPAVVDSNIVMSVAGQTVIHILSRNGVRTQVSSQGASGTAYLRTATYDAELY